MGVALGLTFALILTPFGVSALIAFGSNPHGILLTFVGTCALMLGAGAALTRLMFKLTEDETQAREQLGAPAKLFKHLAI
jgi:hypothetical protein